ncbi:MAG: PspC domain-containing protein [Bacteroidota bacterium]
MKKTVTVNISGIIFHIDEDAFQKLNNYLESLRKHFSKEAGGDEILSDIEARIAEMLEEKIGTRKEVVSISDVDEITAQLGEPGEIGGESTEEETEPEPKKTYSREERKLFRDPDNKMIGGVASGLGAYFNVDATWFRIAFVVFTFFYGFGPLAYLILWIVVPKASTTAERLSMRGEKINVSNIEKSIKEDLQDLKVKFEKFSEENFGKSKKKTLNVKTSEDKLENAILSFFHVIFRIAAIIVGVAFMMAGILALSLFIISLLTGFSAPDNFPVFFSIHRFLEIFFIEAWIFNIALAGVALVVGIPLIMIISAGAGMTFRLKSKSKFWSISAFILWQIGMVFCIISLVYAFNNSDCRNNNVSPVDTETEIIDKTETEEDIGENKTLIKQLDCFFVTFVRTGKEYFIEDIACKKQIHDNKYDSSYVKFENKAKIQ